MKLQVNNELWVPSSALEYALLVIADRVPDTLDDSDPASLTSPQINAINDLVSEPDIIRPELNYLVSIYQALLSGEGKVAPANTHWITGISAGENRAELIDQLESRFAPDIVNTLARQLNGLPLAAETIQGDENKLLTSLTFSLAELLYILERAHQLEGKTPVCASESLGLHFQHLQSRHAPIWTAGTVVVVHPIDYIEGLLSQGQLNPDTPNSFPGEWLYQLERYQSDFDRDLWVQQNNELKAVDVWWCYYRRVAGQTASADAVNWIEAGNATASAVQDPDAVLEKTSSLKSLISKLENEQARDCLSRITAV
ncbi:hypothetical protein [Saccharospirillum alexandrii]|uniref:hypothetical protein n=1 Tax=Saccharospirillum alexandrii TaxID=2448477 RepID=UPI00373606C4